jgi:polyhydroxybutyrate depolymerase
MTLWTPAYINRENHDKSHEEFLASVRRPAGRDYLRNRASQTRALSQHDIRTPYANFQTQLDSLPHQSVLAVVFSSDLRVNPQPNRELGAMMGFEVMEIPGDCGHMGPEAECDQAIVARRVNAFLAQADATAASLQRRTLVHDGIEREYYVFRPADVSPDRTLPVVLALHGFGSTATGFQAIYQLNRHAQAKGYMVIYPQGSHFQGAIGTNEDAEKLLVSTWNDEVTNFTPGPGGELHCTEDRLQYPCPPECSSCNHCAWVSCHDDFGFLNRAIDADRLYLLGSSNGGTMAMRLACEMPARFAAIAVNIIQMPPGFDCAPGRSLPLIHLYGEQDDSVGWDGTATSDGWIFTSALATAQSWAAGLQCDEKPSSWRNSITDKHGLQCQAWRDCRVAEHQVVSCRDPGAGHEWRGQRLPDIPADCVTPEQQSSLPGQPPCPAADEGQVSALWGMDLTWQFLSRYRRADSP